jgi:hypothetical protein
MDIDSEAKRPTEAAHIGMDLVQGSLERMTVALAKCTQLMERHLASGEQTVPARALYFILRDAGYGTSPAQKEEVKQEPKQEQQTNQLHHSYGLRR